MLKKKVVLLPKTLSTKKEVMIKKNIDNENKIK